MEGLKQKKQLRAFLGSVGYYRQFIQVFAKMSSLLTPATALSAPRVVSWTQEIDSAFIALRESLCAFVILYVPNLCDVFTLHTDASGLGLGACLHIVRYGKELPVAFWSRQLQGAEHNYSAFELETLAIVAAIDHFMYYLYNTSITVYTDHRHCFKERVVAYSSKIKQQQNTTSTTDLHKPDLQTPWNNIKNM